MFAKTIIDSDAFLDMPITARLLYYDLAMRADDDGFVNSPKKIMRMIGASQDDLGILAMRKFIIPFDNGVVVIKHWRIHNYIRKDTYNETNYKEQKALLKLDENNAYTFVDGTLTDSGRVEDTGKDRIGKDRIGKDNMSNTNVLDCPTKTDINVPKYLFERETSLWNELKNLGIAPIRGITPDSERAKHLKARFNQYGQNSFDEIIKAIKESDFLQGKHGGRPWQVTFDWVILPRNYPKVLEGNYKNSNNTRSGSAFDNIDIGD